MCNCTSEVRAGARLGMTVLLHFASSCIRLTRRRCAGRGAGEIREASRCFCNRASYPGVGVTVGGAAFTGASKTRPPKASTATTAKLKSYRFISLLPLGREPKLVRHRRHFKAVGLCDFTAGPGPASVPGTPRPPPPRVLPTRRCGATAAPLAHAGRQWR
jgi:hypothetical protein